MMVSLKSKFGGKESPGFGGSMLGWLSQTLQFHCNNCILSYISFVCVSSVTRVYCDKTAEIRIMQFSLKCSPMAPWLGGVVVRTLDL